MYLRYKNTQNDSNQRNNPHDSPNNRDDPGMMYQPWDRHPTLFVLANRDDVSASRSTRDTRPLARSSSGRRVAFPRHASADRRSRPKCLGGAGTDAGVRHEGGHGRGRPLGWAHPVRRVCLEFAMAPPSRQRDPSAASATASPGDASRGPRRTSGHIHRSKFKLFSLPTEILAAIRGRGDNR